jgi:hypothetical protein
MLRVLSRWPGMPRKPEQLKSWTIYKVAAKAILLGTVEAPDKKAAIKAAAKELRRRLASVCGAAAMTRPSLTPERRRALELLASSRQGVNAELLVHGHRLSRRILAGLVRAGLVAAKHEMVMAGGKAVEIVRLRITNDGRRLLESLG